ncbi:hypothetical protein [Streptomyces beihaiensis]|uniref:Integral membrane protein n=1 Tax=Streptomyces beihaiensis TaxID=2984495 RepID=A0ABT3TRX4_9ACTN|nr:hypothetical protein [Streptomyces beihaiensis]MCX3059784.1 hypothetical protein [Streptomyces beihaiensis]
MTDPGTTPRAKRPDPPSIPLEPPSYRAPGLIPPGGPARTWGLVVIATPLLLALLAALIGGAAGGSGTSGPGPGPGYDGSNYSGSGVSDTAGGGGGGDGGGGATDPTGYASPTVPSGPYGDTGTPPDPYATTPGAATTDVYGGSGYADGGSTYPPDTASATAGDTAATTGTGPSTGKGPRDVVTAYFAALNAHDYRTAWALGGKNLDSDYNTFVSGYSTTEQDTIGTVSVKGTKVRLTIKALQTDGTTHSYDATYTVRDGEITSGTATQTG